MTRFISKDTLKWFVLNIMQATETDAVGEDEDEIMVNEE